VSEDLLLIAAKGILNGFVIGRSVKQWSTYLIAVMLSPFGEQQSCRLQYNSPLAHGLPWLCNTSTCRSFVTICSAPNLFFGIDFLLSRLFSLISPGSENAGQVI